MLAIPSAFTLHIQALHLDSLLYHLVGSADEVQVVAVEELADHISSECERDAAVVLSPALDVLVWVRPQQIAEEACRVEVKNPPY